MRPILLIFALVLALAAPLPAAVAHTVNEPAPESVLSAQDLVSKMRAARLSGDSTAWRAYGNRVLTLIPDHPDLLISTARASAVVGRPDEVVRLLGAAVRRGAGFDASVIPEFKQMTGDAGFAEVAKRAIDNLRPIGSPTLVALLPGRMSDGITYDPVNRCLFVGSLDGRVYRVEEDGRVSTFFSDESLGEIRGMKVDAQRRLLWMVRGRFNDLNAAQQRPDVGVNGLLALNLATGKLVRAADLDERPILHSFKDIALAQNGDVFVVDNAANSVYRLREGGSEVELLYRTPADTLPNGIALATDQRRLYVAVAEGLTLVDLKTKRRSRLAVPPDAAVNSIDGLSWWEGSLIGVQNSPYLSRIVLISLTSDGRQVLKVTPLNSRNPAEYELTTVTVAGRNVFAVGGNPLPAPAGPPSALVPKPQVLRIALP